MFPSSSKTTSPSLDSSSSARPIAERTLPASEISEVTTSTPAACVNAFTIGNNEYVANAGASSILLQIIFGNCDICISLKC